MHVVYYAICQEYPWVSVACFLLVNLMSLSLLEQLLFTLHLHVISSSLTICYFKSFCECHECSKLHLNVFGILEILLLLGVMCISVVLLIYFA